MKYQIFVLADSSIRVSGEASVVATLKSLLERSSGLSILHPVRVARVEISTTLEFVKAM